MALNYFSATKDEVIGGYVVSAITDYSFALSKLTPLIEKLNIQRDPLKTKFYSRLEKDIVNGCVMPPITVALIHNFTSQPADEEIYKFITDNMSDAFILDGIQRLNTLMRAKNELKFDSARALHVNFLIANSQDKILYRMITLNNGQKPMSPRHQIEILADSFFNFNSVNSNLNLIPEKGRFRASAPSDFVKSDFVKGYIAYLSNSVNIDNQKIIAEKMDELIASKITDSNITTSPIEFTDVVELINKFSASEYLKVWIRNQNNFIGFCVGSKNAVGFLTTETLTNFEIAVRNFESGFEGIDVSKINLGKARREAVSKFIDNINDLINLDHNEFLDKISDWV